MYKIAVVRFSAANYDDGPNILDDLRTGGSRKNKMHYSPNYLEGNITTPEKTYEYRIPKELEDSVRPGMLGIVERKGTDQHNETVVVIKEVKSVLDGNYVGKYAYLIGAVDPTKFYEGVQTRKRKQRLLELIKAEGDKIVNNLDLDKISSLSPEAAELVAEYKKLED